MLSKSTKYIELQDIIHTIIGEEAEFEGSFKMKHSIRIDGVFKGNLISENKVLVGKKGTIETNVKADRVIVAGTVLGNIYAKKYVHLLPSARVVGDISTANLIVDTGCIFEGRANIRS